MLKWIGILSLSGMLVGCSDKRQPNIELIQDMMDQPAVKAQDFDPDGKGGMAMKLPPEGTKPVGFKPYTIKDSQTAERELQNLLSPTDEVVGRGQEVYYTFCFVCHGPTGAGNGPVAEKMIAKPPDLTSDLVSGWKDGGIYHLISAGRGMMGSFASQIPDENDRWAVVHFVRRLQQNK